MQQRRSLQSLVSLPVWKMNLWKVQVQTGNSEWFVFLHTSKERFIYFYKLSSWTCIIRPCNCTSSICDPLPLINYKSIIRSLHFVGFRFSTPPAGDCRSLVDCYESVWIAISLSSWTSKGWATLILCQSIRMPLECAYTTALTILNSCGRQNASSTCIISGATIHTRWQTKNCQETHGAT